jgi:anti-sigma B factor antagonist
MEQPASTENDGSEFPPANAHGLTITVGDDGGGSLVLRVAGEVDTESGRHFSDFLSAAVDQSVMVVVDLGGVDFIDSTGLAALVGASNRARERGGHITLRHPSPSTRRVITLSGVDQIIAVDGDGSEA